MAKRKVGVFKVADRPGPVPAAGLIPPHRSGQIDPLKTTKGRRMTLSEGDKSPAFSLPADGGGQASLADFKGRKLALFFYPKADTEGCTREAMDFTALARSFAKAGTDILGISADPVARQDAFKRKHKLKVPLASDETLTVLKAYGVWGEKSMYGRKFMGITRTTLLIGPDGRIARIWPKVRVPGHAQEVLEAAKEL
jgi:thioredoxin-dependent peroxiredoxin